jgi:hypothetical protein
MIVGGVGGVGGYYWRIPWQCELEATTSMMRGFQYAFRSSITYLLTVHIALLPLNTEGKQHAAD